MKPRSLRAIAILVAGACGAGCHMSRPADLNRRATGALPGPGAWPARDLDAVRGLADRIRYFGGHAGLFYCLPQQTPRLIRWLDRAVSPAPAPAN